MSTLEGSRVQQNEPAGSAIAPAARRVAVLQSSYLPWKGYFDIVADVDLFVFYDDVQYTKHDWRNRNLIKTQAGRKWLTVPVHAPSRRPIFEVEISGVHWAGKHWKTLQQNYSRAPYFHLYEPFLREIYVERKWTRLSELNRHLIVSIAERFLGIRTEFADSCAFEPKGKRLDRLLDLLKRVGATTYLSGPAARGYIDTRRFDEEGVRLVYKTYDGYPEYPQFHPPFEHAVSILDLLFHTGPDAAHYVWGWRTETVPSRVYCARIR